MYGHWSIDHQPGGTLKNNVRSAPYPINHIVSTSTQTSSGSASSINSAPPSTNGLTIQFGLANALSDHVEISVLSPIPDAQLPSSSAIENIQVAPTVPDPHSPSSSILIQSPDSGSESDDWSQYNDEMKNKSVIIDTSQAHLALYTDSDQTDLSPMVDDGASYSAIGLTELALVFKASSESLDDLISPLPE